MPSVAQTTRAIYGQVLTEGVVGLGDVMVTVLFQDENDVWHEGDVISTHIGDTFEGLEAPMNKRTFIVAHKLSDDKTSFSIEASGFQEIPTDRADPIRVNLIIQTSSSDISGTVLMEKDGVRSDARGGSLRIHHGEFGFIIIVLTRISEDGKYELSGLPAGSYDAVAYTPDGSVLQEIKIVAGKNNIDIIVPLDTP